MAQSGKKSKQRGVGITRAIVVIACLTVWAFIGVSLVSFDRHDAPTHLIYPPNEVVRNWCGPIGAMVAYHAVRIAGFGAYLFVTLLGFGLLSAAAGQMVKHPPVRVLGLLMLAGATAGLQNVFFPASGPFPGEAGGLIGLNVAQKLRDSIGGFGAATALLSGGLIGALVAMDEIVIALFGWMWKIGREKGAPVALAAGSAAGGMAISAGSAAAKGAAKGGKGLWAAFVGLVSGEGRGAVRENDLDDELPRGGRRGRASKSSAGAAGEVEGKLRPAVAILDPDDPANAVDVEAEEPSASGDTKFTRGRRKSKNAKGDAKPQADGEDAGELPMARPAGNGALARDEAADEDDDSIPGAPQVYSEDALREKIAKLPIVFGHQNKQVATDADLRTLQDSGEDEAAEAAAAAQPAKPYQFPGLDLLENPEENFSQTLESYVREQATALESAMRQYGIAGEVVGIESGPVITMYDVRLSPGTKVSAITAVQSDIARSLKAINIRIVSNQEGKDTVGVEVPNLQKEKVRLKELMSQTDRFSKMKLPMFLGKDASGEPLIEDLTKMPHMLIAGTTGSGKSVCMNTIIMGFLYTRKPSELKMVLVDPKMVEMSQFKDIPHLMCPVVTEMSKAAAILEWACAKMDERYELLAEAGCRDIAAYNELEWDELRERLQAATPEEEARIPRKLPYMVFIIDELADLMMTAKEVEGSIIRIAQKARAVGIHLILATQRPQANVVTGLIKSNMPARLTFKVASGMDSRIVLDQKGGELLLGQGDMLFLSPRSSKLTRSQGTLVDDREIRRVVKFMKDVAGPSFERQLLQIKSGGVAGDPMSDEARIQASVNNSSASLQAAQEDPMFPRAVEIVLETKRGSVSLLQRRLAIGYTRASRLIDLMGIAGILGEHKGSVARDVMITIEDWQTMKRLAADEAAAKGLKVGGINADAALFEPGAASGGSPGGDAPSPDSSGDEPPFEADDEELDDTDGNGRGTRPARAGSRSNEDDDDL